MSKPVDDDSKLRGDEPPLELPFSPAIPTGKSISVMRKFLESEMEFQWPDNFGQCFGNHCVLPDSACIPLVWTRTISDKGGLSIKVYKGGADYVFKEAFIVKTIRDSNYSSSRAKAAKEVENMKDLRHPHIAALLGTFLHSSLLNILIYPAARCNLHQFLNSISKELSVLYDEKFHHSPNFESHSDGWTSPVSTDACSDSDQQPPLDKTWEDPTGCTHDEVDPLSLSLTEKIDSLRQYFVCLSQALNYIHESDLRHKDVKPKNVLIDSSGSVVLTDFGISRRFPKSTSHETNDKWEWTRKYASPEIMKGKKVPRGDPSDVFSLGCVFLEMATCILRKNLDSFCAYNSLDEIDAYYCNLEKTYKWIEILQESQRPVGASILDASLIAENVESHNFMPDLDQEMVRSLGTIQRMLNENPSNRPSANGLWKHFQSVSARICCDCDERNENRWRPSRSKQKNTDLGESARRFQHIHGIAKSAGNELSRLSPKIMPAEHNSIQHRASSSATHRQSLSIPVRQSPLLNPYTDNSCRQNSSLDGSHPTPFTSRSTRSSLNLPRSPLVPGISRSSIPESRGQYRESQKFEETSYGQGSEPFGTSQLAQSSIDQQSVLIPGSQTQVSAFPSNTDQNPKPGSWKNNERERQDRIPCKEKLNPLTPILVYDKEDTLVYAAVFSVLKGRIQPPLMIIDLKRDYQHHRKGQIPRLPFLPNT